MGVLLQADLLPAGNFALGASGNGALPALDLLIFAFLYRLLPLNPVLPPRTGCP